MFRGIRTAWKEARGNLLFDQAFDTFHKLLSATSHVKSDVVLELSVADEKLQQKLYMLSEDGRKQAGKTFQSKARDTFDFDVGRGTAMWLHGAWLELQGLPGIKARQAYKAIDLFLQRIHLVNPDDASFERAVNAALTIMGEGGAELSHEQLLQKLDNEMKECE